MKIIKKTYYYNIKNKLIKYDIHQKNVIFYLQQIYNNLNKSNNIWQLIKNIIKNKKNYDNDKNKNGIYLYGNIGSGKTYTTELLYNQLETNQKIIMHFHKFMHMIHINLKKFQGIKDPLLKTINNITKNIKILILDELYISDITDAMIIEKIFNNIFKKKIIIIITSNIKPENLYQNGLQRQKFITTIKIIEENLNIIEIKNNIDYRLIMKNNSIKYYIYPHNEEKLTLILNQFDNKYIKDNIIIINKRNIKTKYLSNKIIWFEFEEIIKSPRNQIDYMTISKKFKIIFINNIFQMNDFYNNETKRFIMLIDELYRNNIITIISSNTTIEDIYIGNIMKEEFKRTISRINEMQSQKYTKNILLFNNL